MRMFKNQLKTGMFLSYSIIFVSLSISIFFTPYLLNVLGASEYGIYQLVGSIVAALDIFDLAISSAISKYIARYRATKNKDDEKKVISLSIIILSCISIIGVLLVVIIYFNFNNIFSNGLSINEINLAKSMLIVVGINLSFKFPMCAFGSIMAGYEEFIFPRIMNLFRLVLSPIVIILFINLGFRSLSIVIITTIFSFLYGIGNYVYIKSKLNLSFKIKIKGINKEFFLSFVKFTFNIGLIAAVTQIYWKSGQIILGITSSSNEIAMYSIIITICVSYNSLSTSISSMLLPKITKMISSGSENSKIEDYFIKISKIQFIILSLFVIGFIFVGEQFILIWLGEGFEKVWVGALIILVPITFTMSQNIGQAIMQAKNKHYFFAKINLMIAIIGIIASLKLSKHLGVIGIAIGSGSSIFISEIIILNFYYFKSLKLNMLLWWKSILKLMLWISPSILIGIFISSILKEYNILNFIMKTFIITVSYITCIYLYYLSQKKLLVTEINV